MDLFINQYIENLTNLLKNIDTDSIKNIINLLDNTNGKIYIIGNGGSSSTASHMVNDLGVGLARREIRYFDIQSLADNTAVTTAIANDIGYENIFSIQLKNKLKKEDILIAISCSGNSSNIISAANYAKKIGSKIVGITGFDGGQ
ncbi:SIS domain-containing protein, partial [Poseidonibacter sp.]|uniref:SIS domain-containing protein n=1 Tax=Poseidonibacter sp. TaxID=2321188 RepID=UPI003C786C2E